MSKKLIICDTEKCEGCRICEYVCSIAQEKTINPRKSRIKSLRIEPIFNISVSCMRCEEPACVKSCPVEALKFNEEKGIVEVNEDKCVGCGWCVENCTFGVMTMHLDKKKVIVCNFCDGDPECVKNCPKEALSYETIDEVAEEKRRELFKKLLDEIKK